MSDEIVQGTDEWKQLRLGKVTASRIADLMAKTKSGPSASRATYMAQLICERLTGAPAETYVNDAMRHGTETEPEARCAYEFYRNETVEQVAFVAHPKIDQAGCSPDGLVGSDGMVEIKCPQTPAHLDTLLGKSVPGKYALQIQFQMACTGRKWCDFVSYDPRLPEHLRMFVCRVERDEAKIKEIEKEIAGFLLEVAVKLAQLNNLLPIEQAAE